MHYVGIDIAKRKHVVFTLDGEGELVGKALRVADDREGFDNLLAHLSSDVQLSPQCGYGWPDV